MKKLKNINENLTQKSAISNKKNNISLKNKLIIGSIFSIILITVLSVVFFLSKEKNKIQEELNVVENKWNSDAKLIDDRLNENDPIFMIVSPVIIEGTQGASSIIIYNNGYKVSELFRYDTYDEFMEELSKKDAFIDDARTFFEVFSESENTHSKSGDIKPSDIRETYLEQYQIDDFSLKTTIDMTNVSNTNPMYIFGVTYDNELTPSSHMYYGVTDSKTTIPSYKKAYDWFEKFARIYVEKMYNENQ